MQRDSILFLSNDLEFYTLIRDAMQKSGMDAHQATSPTEAFTELSQWPYCLVIMDIPFLTKKHFNQIHTMRESITIPILALIAKADEGGKAALFRAGVNACLEKPVDLIVCTAQAESLVQLYLEAQAEDIEHKPLVFGNELIINPIYRQVIIDGEPLTLTRTEFDLLFCLAQHPGQVWSRGQLYSYVWADDLGASGDNTVRAHIGNIRKKLADTRKNYIQNSRGVGYRFVPPVPNKKN